MPGTGGTKDTGPAPLPLRRTGSGGPLRIGVLVSATGANLRTLIDLQRGEPDRYEVALVASHGTRSKALDLAREHGIEAWPGDFDARCGTASQATGPDGRAAYRQRARQWHDGLNTRIAAWEADHGPLDLVVLAYHRWIEGDLLTRHHGRMINQHPGDLALLDETHRRVLTGNDPVAKAMELGHTTTRTSCFLVDESHDGGAVLCQGPPVPVRHGVDPWAQELEQKRLSDRPCLEWAVRAFAGRRTRTGSRQPSRRKPDRPGRRRRHTAGRQTTDRRRNPRGDVTPCRTPRSVPEPWIC